MGQDSGQQAVIYVQLLDEGVEVWRPVDAVALGEDRYRIIGSPPDDTEQWEFGVGSVVRCKPRTLSSGQIRLVAYEEDLSAPTSRGDEPTPGGDRKRRTPARAAVKGDG